MKSVSQSGHSFAQIPKAEIQRSSFDRSHGLKTTFDAGWLVPVFCDEVLPGDTINLRMNTFARLATPVTPLMDNLKLTSFWFAVPIRLIWSNWQEFHGEQLDPDSSTDFTCPTVPSGVGGFAEQSMADYFGLPTKVPGLDINAFMFRAYNQIWNEWFRDENLQDHAVVNTTDGPDQLSWYIIRNRGKRHNYFTSCLPWPSKGDPVSIPLGTTAPVVGEGTAIPTFNVDVGTYNLEGNGSDTNVDWSGSPGNTSAASWADTALEVDLTSATAATINSLRLAFQVQRLYERDARGGTRYTEIIRSHFGVTSPDQRLQRPEYLGGGTQQITITPVPQQSSTDGTSPQGNLAGYGTSAGNNHGFTKSFTEHCVVIGLVSVQADLTYQYGLHKMWTRSTRWDYYYPALANIGEQAVLNKELYAQGSDDAAADAAVWGYQARWDEYRHKGSQITGLFRSNSAVPLDFWHLAEKHTSLPVLDDAYIQDAPPIDRVIAVPSEPHFLFDAYFQMTHTRPMPTFGVPGLIDHF